ncbi:CRISPR-associated helicase Cas3' [Endozoicomonas sp. ALB115]|uniref:CRISPR-associated helicase Cas3' n=1 Tax=Endozoicomonas sp. ALB115 TaxID=3403074 RepID=UPI003BB68625
MSFYNYWGKAGNQSENDNAGYHLLAYHCLDVAAVGRLLLDPEKTLCQSLARRLEVEPGWLQRWFTFCLMLHDVGKFARSFQNKVTGLSSELVSEVTGLKDIRHDSLGFALWAKELSQQIPDIVPPGKTQRLVHPWLEIVCGHHGKPPQGVGAVKTALVPEEDIPAAEAFLREIAKHWLPDLTPLSSINKKRFKNTSWQLAGIAVLADWLGSDQSIFQYKSDIQPLPGYWEQTALLKAKEVLSKSEFEPKTINPFSSIKDQFDFILQPTPLQQFAQTIDIPQSPQLFILEDVTGAGKTEAAMVLVHRLLSQGLAEGLYVGLPTMATANGMYNRLKDSYRSLFQEKPKPSLVLAHGASQLSEHFQESIQLVEQENDQRYAVDDQSASAYCNQWLADSRKKALLADVGVGTIDQVLLAVLPARHQSLRMLGLEGKVLLLDEVHAYDSYMRELLAALLQAHASQGGSVILLSATLPHQFRKELLDAYLKGRGLELQSLPATKDYPLVSQACDQGFAEKQLPTRDSVKRQVKVKSLNDPAQAIDLIIRSVEQGCCICWIRNTIKDARSAWQQLQDDSRIDSAKLTLFHSRFSMIDRQTIEEDVLNRFGKKSGSEQRTGQILIATQVVEQSLDLDFDMMISDLAPMDLLIQRAGRLQRHNRDVAGNPLNNDQPDQRLTPCFYLLTPDPQQVHSDQWLRSILPGTQGVYSHVGQLWLTARLLLEKQGFAMPEDARDLIEGVYGVKAQTEIPEQLQQASDDALAKDNARKNMGEFNCLKLEAGYSWKSGGPANGWDEDTHIPTRLNAVETEAIVLAVPDGDGHLQPLANSGNPKHFWRLSQLQLPIHEWEKANLLIPDCWSEEIERIKQKYSCLKYVQILPLVAETEHLYQAQCGWDLDRKPC